MKNMKSNKKKYSFAVHFQQAFYSIFCIGIIANNLISEKFPLDKNETPSSLKTNKQFINFTISIFITEINWGVSLISHSRIHWVINWRYIWCSLWWRRRRRRQCRRWWWWWRRNRETHRYSNIRRIFYDVFVFWRQIIGSCKTIIMKLNSIV